MTSSKTLNEVYFTWGHSNSLSNLLIDEKKSVPLFFFIIS